MKRDDWRLIGILGVGLGLRCINLSTRSIQYDDAFSFFLARRDLPAIVQGTAADTMPPLYYFLLHFWMQISQNIEWLRLLSIGLDLAAVFLLFLLVKTIFNEQAGLWAAFFGVISPLQIYHSQDLRMYALLLVLQMGYLYFFYSWWAQHQSSLRKSSSWMWVLIFGTAAMYTHNLAVFLLCVPNLFLIIKRQWCALRNLFLVQFGIGLLTIPWILMIPEQVEKIQRAFWTPKPGIVEVIQSIIVMTTNLPLDGVWLILGAIISFQIFILISIELIRQRSLRDPYLIFAFLLPPTLLFFISYIMRPVFIPRGFITSTLVYLGIAGAIAGLTQRKGIKWIFILGFVVASGIALPYQMAYEQFPRSPFEKSMMSISQAIQPGERIIHDNKLSHFPSLFYAPNLKQSFMADETGSPNDTYAPASQIAIGLLPENILEEAIENAPSIYFVVFQKTIDEYIAMGESDHPSLIWLQNRFAKKEISRVGDIRIYHFAEVR